MNKIQIAIIDDHALFRKGLTSLLHAGDIAEVIMQAGSGEELIEKLKFNRPEVILLDLSMPGGITGQETLRRVRKTYPSQKIIIISMNNDDGTILNLMELGANGYLFKEAEPEEVEIAIQSVSETGFYFNEQVSKAMLQKLVNGNNIKPTFKTGSTLTDRELEVLKLVCREFTNAEIADKLFLSARTVEGHRKKIMAKLGVRNTVGMVIYAIKQGWVVVDEIN